MKDRTIDVTSSTTETSVKQRFHYPLGTPTGGQSSGQVTVRSVRKRVPTGGPFNRFSQKPFTHYRLDISPYRGVVHLKVSGVAYTLKETGSMMGTYSAEGGTVSLGLERFPPVGGARWGTNIPPGVNPDLLSQAEVGCLNKLRSRSGEADMNYGLWYGERKETARLFRDTAYAVLNVARAIAQKDYGRSARVLRDAFGVKTSAKAEARRMQRVERWLRYEAKRSGKVVNRTLKGVEDAVLQYNLGVSPLLKDLETAHIRLQTGDLTVKCAISARHRVNRTQQDLYTNNAGLAQQRVTISRLDGYTVTLVAVPNSGSLADLSRVGLTNPVNTAWQLLGGSFLVDYLLPIGPYLQALDVPLAFTFKAGSWTHRVSQVMTGTITSFDGGKARGQSVLDYTQRRIYGTFPVPIPPLSLRDDALSFRQATNAGLLALKSLRKLCGL